MFGLNNNTPRLDEAEARIAGLVKLAGQHEELHQRLAKAIDELEVRQANALVVTNAAFSSLQKLVQTSHDDNVALASAVQTALDEVAKMLGSPAAEASPTPGSDAALEPPVSVLTQASAPQHASRDEAEMRGQLVHLQQARERAETGI